MRRIAIVGGATTVLLLISATQALAAHCTVAKKPQGAGSMATVNLVTGEVTATGAGKGGFVSLDFDGDGTGDSDVFDLPVTPALEDDLGVGVGVLPEAARGAGPGDALCDGKGVDDLFACG